MGWKLLSVKIPPELHTAITRESGGDIARFVRQALAERLGVTVTEKPSGLAGATPETRRRVATAGVRGRAKAKQTTGTL